MSNRKTRSECRSSRDEIANVNVTTECTSCGARRASFHSVFILTRLTAVRLRTLRSTASLCCYKCVDRGRRYKCLMIRTSRRIVKRCGVHARSAAIIDDPSRARVLRDHVRPPVGCWNQVRWSLL